MAENAKIAALRAASPTAPPAASGPKALAYDWMSRAGSDLVIPNRAPIDQQAWRDSRGVKPKPPGNPVFDPPGGVFPGRPGKSVLPPDVPPGRPPAFDPPTFPGAREPIEDIVPINWRGPRNGDDFAGPVVDEPTAFEPSFNFYTGDLTPADVPVPQFEPASQPVMDEQPPRPPASEPVSSEARDTIMPTLDVQEYISAMPEFMPYSPAAPALAPAPAPQQPEPIALDPAVLAMLYQQQQQPAPQLSPKRAPFYASPIDEFSMWEML